MIEFDVDTTPEGIGVVTPRGRLNMVAARDLKQLLAQLVQDGTVRIVVDLHDVSFLDSSGLGALIGGVKTTRQQGGDLRIVAPSEPVVAILEFTNLHRVLRPRDSVEEAFGA